MTERSAEQTDQTGERWNADENPAVEGDQFLFVAAINLAVRQLRKWRTTLRR